MIRVDARARAVRFILTGAIGIEVGAGASCSAAMASIGVYVQALSGLIAEHETSDATCFSLNVFDCIAVGIQLAFVNPASTIRHQFAF
jgi:hypothetical protein